MSSIVISCHILLKLVDDGPYFFQCRLHIYILCQAEMAVAILLYQKMLFSKTTYSYRVFKYLKPI